jgi:hypothetical protein
MGDISWAFQDRAEDSGNNGDDFERFVLECFRVAKEEIAFIKSLRRGRDGAIDLIDQHSEVGATTVAECKYIGEGGFREAKARWKEVYSHLNRYLPDLCANPNKNPKSPYRTWLDSSRPVQRYRFCITASLTPSDVIQLEKLIAHDLADLANAGVEAVRYLAETEGAIRVFSWDWFCHELTFCPSLAFRWFRGLPIGISLFDRSGRKGQSFRDFLGSGQLAYLSRDSFAAQTGGTVVRGEAELVTDLVAGDTNALVITGPGGVGKTRLAHELAIRLTDESAGFDAYWLDRGANAVSVKELARRYPRQASILLLVDYAEAAQRLGEIADVVVHLTEQAGHRVRIIATCRASATNRVRDDFEILDPEIKPLASQLGGEDAYLDWVTNRILRLEPFPEPDALTKVCHGIPALAAFAVYLFRNDHLQFNTQFGALLSSDDFRSWSNKRIAALIKGTSFTERGLAEVALSLPMPIRHQTALRQKHGDLLDRLITDRWIEHVDGDLVAAHDILSDALLARWLFEAETSTTDRTIELLEASASAQDLSRALSVIARLVTHAGFAAIDGPQVLMTLLTKHHEQVMLSVDQLFRSPFLHLQDKLYLIANSMEVAHAIAIDRSLHLGLAQLAKHVTKFLDGDTALVIPQAFGDLLDEVCSEIAESNFVLRRAFAFDPSRFRERAFANIRLFPNSEQSHFLIAQMLRSGEDPEEMRGVVSNWLVVNHSISCASFIYRAWLDAGGDRDAVSRNLLAWVDARGLTPEASHVYKAWLDAGGDRDAVGRKLLAWVDARGLTREATQVYKAWLDAEGDKDVISQKLLAWVDARGLTREAEFVYEAWLDAGGDRGAVSEKLLAWVDAYGLMPEASHVYKAWLDAGGDRNALSDKLLAWVGVRGLTPEAQFTYNAWLAAGGDGDAIREKLLAWLDVYGLTPEARFIYNTWLDAGGDRDAVSEKLLAWIEAHGLTPGASHVYKAWLDAGGDKDAVSDKLLAWMDVCGELFEADHVYRSWLNAGGDFVLVEQHLFKWALRWSHTKDFVYLSKNLSMRPMLPEPVAIAVARWAATFPQHEDSIVRMRRVVEHLQPDDISITSFTALIGHLLSLAEAPVSRPPFDRSQIWSICVSLGRPRLFNLNPFGVLRLVARFVGSGLVFDENLTEGPLHYLADCRGVICYLTIAALREGMLDPARDHEALTRFLGWVETAARGPSEATCLADRLRREIQ